MLNVLLLAGRWIETLARYRGLRTLQALVRGLSVPVVACPCAVGLAVPLASLAGTARGLEQGVVFRDPVAMEMAGNVRSVAFDKTGTLTLGELAVTITNTAPELSQHDVLGLAARIEWGSVRG
jgi:Cu2+-exporting ATPase/Cu+-exporting ATPase